MCLFLVVLQALADIYVVTSIWSSVKREGSQMLTDIVSASAGLPPVLQASCVSCNSSQLFPVCWTVSPTLRFLHVGFHTTKLNNSSSLNVFLQFFPLFFFLLPHPSCLIPCWPFPPFFVCFCLVSFSKVFLWHVFPSSVLSTVVAILMLSKTGTWNFWDYFPEGRHPS